MSKPEVGGECGGDHDIDDEDLDAFLVLIESRLRADWTSPDLSRIILSQGTCSRGTGNALTTLPSGNSSSPSKFLRLITRVFHLAAKPIKLQILMSMLGLESDRTVSANLNQPTLIGASHFISQDVGLAVDSDDKKTDKIILQLLKKAEDDEEMWVRIVGGILHGIMFKSSSDNSNIEGVETVNTTSACRGKTAEDEMKKITDEIMRSVREAAKEANADLEDAKCSFLEQNKSEVSKKSKETLVTYLIGKDSCPSFAPLRYSLLSADTIRSVLPEADGNPHFRANMEASIFKVDVEIEEKRAEEESKDTNIQKQTIVTNVKSSMTSVHVDAVSGKSTNGIPASNVTGIRADAAMLLGRGGRGRFSNGLGRDGRGGRDSGASLFRPSSNGLAGRGSLGRGALAGRGNVLARSAGGVGATSAAGKAPLARRVPGSKQAMLTSSSRGTGDSSKMKMIDVSEVQKEREQLSTKEERKRKLMEDAKASGLRKEKKARAPIAADENEGATKSINANSSVSSSSEGRQGWESLLEKSNKLSDDDRQNIRQFFENRSLNPTNPLFRPAVTDESGVWRCKLNEEKTVDPQTGESVKETLYLDLDYNTLGYKLTRKIKKK